MMQQGRISLFLLHSKGRRQQAMLHPLCLAFTSPSHPNCSPNSSPKPPSSDFNNTLLNSLLQKDKTPCVEDKTSAADTDPATPPPSIVKPNHHGLRDLAMGIPIFFGLWLVTCGSIYTAVKTNSLDTQALFGMDRSYAVEKAVSSMEWYTGLRPTEEQIANQDINDALLAVSITKLTSPFRLLMTLLLMNRPSAADKAAPPK